MVSDTNAFSGQTLKDIFKAAYHTTKTGKEGEGNR